jgi:hypothetical protein
MDIERNPGVPDNFLVLERKERFSDYARTYGDALAEHLENRGVLVIPFMPIRFDLEQFQSMTFPSKWKKIGTANGLEEPLYEREGQNIRQATDHPLLALGLGSKWACYLQSQITGFNSQLRRGLNILFPAYHSLWQANITWRLTHTVEEGMHFDSFDRGSPLDAPSKTLHRVKIFLNIDSEPRVWRTSLDLPGVLSACRDQLPDELPDDVNVLNSVIDKLGVLKALPYHKLAYPTMSAVICNSEAVAHEVVYGRRVIGGEFLCAQEDMLDPGKLTHRCLRGWLEQGNYAIAADPATIVKRYAHLKHSDELLQEARQAQPVSA